MRIAVHEQPSHRHRPPRPAFTLVEVLIVVVIIGILAGLTLPAISRVFSEAKFTESVVELTTLMQAIERFKARYGVYPPSRIRLRENTSYSMADPFDQHSIRYLKRIWPNIVLQVTPGASATYTNPPPFGWYYEYTGSAATAGLVDGNGNGVYELEGDECLVFFLGGITAAMGASGPYVQHGFTSRPSNPSGVPNATAPTPTTSTGPQTLQREPKLFEFDPSRLFVRSNAQIRTPVIGNLEFGNMYGAYADVSNTPGNPNFYQMPSFRPKNSDAGVPRPIAYFSAYEGQGYRPQDCNIPQSNDSSIDESLTTPNPPMPANYQHAYLPGLTAGVSLPPNPYTTSDPNPQGSLGPRWDGGANQAGAIIQYFNPQTFQLISPGRDGRFGWGGKIPRPQTQVLVNGKSELIGSGAAYDNVTNISGSERLGVYNQAQSQ